ncbi:PilZ domain-containing protein [Sphingobium sp. 3R8]|uniref:PilZ domain-containing protein n=1 Tax=Sphingobium sp. 3R8 TaxID=2874921 RepID=UPI001CCA0B80|nr:PilZ domain-containing protein [Sphingobium sp. 3R8]MBZ9647452.1 PilZ domain-containing protein [Sphingobium sp. 3R8]
MTDRGSFTALDMRQRGAARHKLFEPLALRHAGVLRRAHMLDLSVSGALLHAERPPRIGDGVIIEFQDLAAVGHVIWVRAKRFGVRFDVPLPETALRAMLDGGGAGCS